MKALCIRENVLCFKKAFGETLQACLDKTGKQLTQRINPALS